MRNRHVYLVILIAGLFLVAIVAVGTVAGYSKRCLGASSYEAIDACITVVIENKNKIRQAGRWLKLPVVSDGVRLLEKVEPFLAEKDYLLGADEPINYLVLLQNDKELRTNGGFMGSYAVIKVNRGEMEVRFQDIYVPDGQIVGYVDPPAPIQKAFQTGSHRLPNADWSPDFPRSASAIRWFFDKGGEITPDVLVTLNLSTVREIMEIAGEVRLSDYDMNVNADNLYEWLQDNSEVGSFPGSTQKKDVITATGKAVIQKLGELGWREKLQIADLLIDDLDKQNVLVNSMNESVQSVLGNKDWDGEYSPTSRLPAGRLCLDDDCQALTVGVIEMNLGANKANCCVERRTKHKITRSNGEIVHLIELSLENSSPYESAKKPEFYGGNYLSYLRFYLPIGARDIQVSAEMDLPEDLGIWPEPYQGDEEGLDTDEVYGFREVGLFHLTKAGTKSVVKVLYKVREENVDNLQLTVLKQHGLRESPIELEVSGKKYEDDLENDYAVSIER